VKTNGGPGGPLTQSATKAQFGLFEVNLKSGELRRSGSKVRLQAQPFRVLSLLLEQAGEVVSKEELQQRLWGTDTVVDFDHSLGTAINKIREALGDSAENPRFIETLSRRGYRFIAPVSFETAPHAETVTAVAGEFAHRTPREALAHYVAPHSPLLQRLAFGLAGLILLALAFLAGMKSSRPRPPAPALISQVTFSDSVSPGDSFLEDLPGTATDGTRLYFAQIDQGNTRLTEALIADGQTRNLDLPDEIVAPLLGDISPDGSKLLIRNHISAEAEQTLWVVPTLGGAARRISGILAHDAAWMPDGAHILYATANKLVLAREDGSGQQPFATVPGRAFWLRLSPDGKKLRMTLLNPQNHTTSLWEMDSTGKNLHPLLPGWSTPESECCGSWTADGRYFVFQSQHSGGSNLWMLHDGSKPVQLTNGPLKFGAPVTARNGDRLFFIGADSHFQLMEYNAHTQMFETFKGSLAMANRVEFSRDGKWMAWISPHDNSLWRSRVDGSERVQLTSEPMELFLMHWSPDDQQLVFMAREPGKLWQVYTIDADGNNLKVVHTEDRNQADPDWSPDGKQIVFGRVPALMGENAESKTISLLDLATGKVTEIPGSQGLFSPRWSPDGRYIAALSLDMSRLMLYDTSAKNWQTLTVHSVADPVWAHDGKSLFFHDYMQRTQTIYQVSVPGGEIETIAPLRDLRFANAIDFQFAGLTPSDTPLVNARMSAANIYSMQLGGN
jgi:Tol biopolymer transport system component/DNA-binding winged helix-turn-helix (wHTH) protein